MVIFAAPTAHEKEFYGAAQDILADLKKGASTSPRGKIIYKERKPEGKPK